MEFWSISLTNVYCEVIAKILANRIKPLLNKIISPNQTAFIEGRWINEDCILVQEIIHTNLFLKNFGFHHTNFIQWITQCITNISFSILINGSEVFSEPLGG